MATSKNRRSGFDVLLNFLWSLDDGVNFFLDVTKISVPIIFVHSINLMKAIIHPPYSQSQEF